ncbi:MAG: hypothetical protein AB7U76_24345 [Pirellulales bacterium]
MNQIVAGVGVAALAMIIVSKTVRAEITAGALVPVGVVCLTEAAMREVAKPFTEGKYQEAQERFEVHAANGECTMAPNGAQGMASSAEKFGPEHVDPDGDTVQGYLVQVGGFWSMVFDVITKGGKS